MNPEKTDAVVAQLVKNADGIKYGSVAVSFKLHDSRVVSITYSTTENTLEVKNKNDSH